MKRSDFRQALKIRWIIVRSCTIFNFKESMAFAANNWANLLSMFTYMITYLIFLGVLFGKVNQIAGYGYVDMLFFTLVSQINFYLTSVFSQGSIEELDNSVNIGTLDMWLVKPVPSLWFATFQRINLNQFIFGGVPAIIPTLVIMSGKWSALVMTFPGIISGILCIFMGQVVIHCFQFMMAMTAFFTGEGKQAKNMALELSLFADSVPYEGYPNFLKIMGFTIIPFIIHTALATSFFLGKTTNYALLLYVFVLMLAFLWGKSALWKLALKHYSSASS